MMLSMARNAVRPYSKFNKCVAVASCSHVMNLSRNAQIFTRSPRILPRRYFVIRPSPSYFSTEPSKSEKIVDKNADTKTSEASNEPVIADPTSEEERRKRGEKMARNSKRLALFGGPALIVMAVWMIYEFGPAKRDEYGNVVSDEHSGTRQNTTIFPESLPMQYICRTWDAWNEWQLWITEPSRDKLLPDPLPEPYIQPKYTLVIELTGVFVAPEWQWSVGWRFKKRPAVTYFLRQVGYPNYEVVIYTKENGMTVHPIVDGLDPEQKIMYRLYRDATNFKGNKHRKDLGKLNRDLKRVICIDWDAAAVSDYPENTLLIPQWTGDDNDTSLVDLAELLKVILITDPDDVRPILKHYAQVDNPAKYFRDASEKLASTAAVDPAEKHEHKSLASNYSGKLFGIRRHAS